MEVLLATAFRRARQHTANGSRGKISDLNYSTYIDDVAMIAGGEAAYVQDILVLAAIKFKAQVIDKRKLKLSVKSTVVSNDLKLAHRIAKELADHGITVLVAKSHREVGIEFNAATVKSNKMTIARHLKAKREQLRLSELQK